MLKILLNILFFMSMFTFRIGPVPLLLISQILLVIIIIFSLMTDKSFLNFKYKSKNDSTFIFSIMAFSMWSIYSLITVVFSKDISTSFQIINNLLFLLGIIFAMRLQIKSVGDFFGIINTLSLAVIFHSIIGWSEILFKKYYFVPSEYKFEYSHKGFPVSTFYNTNNYAMYLFVGFFMLYISFKITNSKPLKLILLFAMISTLILVIQTDSRGCLGAILIGIIIIIIINMRNLQITPKKLGVMYAILSLFIVIAFYLFTNYFDNLVGLFVKKKSHESNSIRLNLWKNGLYFLTETKLKGVGIGNLDYWLLNKSKFATYGFTKIHNWWIEILSTYGLFIFILYVVSYSKQLFFYLKYSYEKNFKYRHITTIFSGLLSGFIIAAMSPSTLFVVLWIWPILGVFTFGTFIFIKDK